jgi:WD40 repeat protein
VFPVKRAMNFPSRILPLVVCLVLAPDVGRAGDTPLRITPTDRHGDPLPKGAVARLGTMRFRQGFTVGQAVFSPDGKRIAAAARAGGVCVWDAATGRKLFQLSKANYDSCVAYSPDGKLLAVPGETNAIGDTVRLFDPATGKELRVLQTARSFGIMCLAFSPDSKTLALGSHDAALVWDVVGARQLFQLNGHQDYVGSLAFSPGGKLLASGGWDEMVILWDAATGKELDRLTKPGDDGVGKVTFSPDGKLLAVATWRQPLRLWDVATRRLLRTLSGHTPAGCVAFSPDGKLLACGESDGAITLRDQATGNAVRRWKAHAMGTTSVAFTPDGKTLVSGAAWDSGPRQWDVATGKELHALGGHHGAVMHLAFAPDGGTLVSGGMDKTVQRWNLKTCRPEDEFRWATEGHDAFVLSPDGRTLATRTFRPWGKPESTLRLWDVTARKEIRTLGGGNLLGGLYSTGAFSPRGRLLAVWNKDQTLRFVDLATGKEREAPKGLRQPVGSAVFSGDGTFLAATRPEKVGNAIHVWDIGAGREVRTWHTREHVSVRAFSPDGAILVATDNGSGAARLWNVATGKTLRTVIGYEHSLTGLAFSAEGRYLAAGSGGSDSRTAVWETSTGQQVRQFPGQPGWVWSVAFAPDGRTLAAGGGDSTILLWDLTGRMENGRLRPVHLPPPALDARWNDLAGSVERAYDAGWEMVAAAEQAVPFLDEHLKRPAPVSRDRLNRLVADLDGKRFAAREKATRELHDLGDLAEAALRQALAARPGPEARRRIEKLLAGLDWNNSPDRLRLLRALGVLEQAATSEARRVLEKPAARTPEDRLAREAKVALERLTKRTMADR